MYHCAQNKTRQHAPKKSQATGVKNRDELTMNTFECHRWLHITIHDYEEIALVKIGHRDDHVPYWSIDGPSDVVEFVRNNPKLTPGQVGPKIESPYNSTEVLCYSFGMSIHLRGVSSSGLSSGTSSAATIAATRFIAGSSRTAPTESISTEPPPSQMSHGAILTELSKRRVEAAALESEPPQKKARQERTCRKCAVQDCPGKGNVKWCRNPCRDCGKAGPDKTCSGRNSKKPNYSCTGELAK
ncbi:hypothetical protein B0H10DRAFT_1824353 [Mycena sp. CBHHK59/15]|nr:hypothetical protein B0H10DRAFT_1849401 [Mycena sp. CBHHK59/15]KAJ6600831.1 hypothetical protein B0H10DRAFT_1824353 [Mycena sp. CBHHK59/15]